MWRADVVLEIALLLILLARRVPTQWPALVAFIAALAVRDAILLWADWRGDKLVYFWAYYFGSAVADVTEVLLITEIALKLVGPLKCLRAIVARNVPAMTAVFIFGSIFASIPGQVHEGVPFVVQMTYYCRRLDFAAAAGCSAALILLIGITISLKIQFTKGVRPVVIGLLLEVALTYSQALFVIDGWVAQTVFPSVRSIGFLITLVCFSAPARHVKRLDRMLSHSATSAQPRDAQGVWAKC